MKKQKHLELTLRMKNFTQIDTNTSNFDFKIKLIEYRRPPGEPKEKYKFPLTAGHSMGFEKKTKFENESKFPNVQCPETKYAEEMIKTGFHF